MSIRHGLLALLERGPSHGYQLRADFDAATGETWPLNVGQVYTTLDRLERDGLVAQDGPPDADGRIAYRITDAGRDAVRTWFTSPVPRQGAPRDELAIKLALAVTTPGVDVVALVQTQRRATITSLVSVGVVESSVSPMRSSAPSDALFTSAAPAVKVRAATPSML